MLTIMEILTAVEGAELIQGDTSLTISAVETDTRKDLKNSLFIALKGENFDAHDYLEKALEKGAVALCVSAKFAEKSSEFRIPGSELQTSNIISVPDTLVAYQQIANYYRKKLDDLIVIGITGSCGKTSAKEILKALLCNVCGEEKVFATEANNNNHIGVPLSLLSVKPEHRFAVIEMGTNHPGEIETLAKIAEPDVAIITTIARAHLEFLKDLKGVANEKSSILNTYGKKAPIPIIPKECPAHEILWQATGEIIYTFGGKDSEINVTYLGGNTKGSSFRLSFSSGLFHKEEIPDIEVNWGLNGKHQAMNAAAATIAVLVATPGKAKEKILIIKEALENCRLTGMRMLFSKIDGVEWVNDAYNANPDSMKGAIEWLAEFANKPNSHIVLGDMLEMGEQGPKLHNETLKLALKSLPEANIYTVGPIMKSVADKLHGINTCFGDSEEAAVELKKIIKSGDFVFLKASRGIALEKIQNVF